MPRFKGQVEKSRLQFDLCSWFYYNPGQEATESPSCLPWLSPCSCWTRMLSQKPWSPLWSVKLIPIHWHWCKILNLSESLDPACWCSLNCVSGPDRLADPDCSQDKEQTSSCGMTALSACHLHCLSSEFFLLRPQRASCGALNKPCSFGVLQIVYTLPRRKLPFFPIADGAHFVYPPNCSIPAPRSFSKQVRSFFLRISSRVESPLDPQGVEQGLFYRGHWAWDYWVNECLFKVTLDFLLLSCFEAH